MSNSIEDLIDYSLVKKCCKCKSKTNFLKNSPTKDGFHPHFRAVEKSFLKNTKLNI